MQKKNLYIVAGCNGAGKTTASFNILPEMLNCREFINADEIARGLSPFHPEKVAIEAGRLMLGRIQDLLESGTDFAFETTLATKSFKSTIMKARAKGYHVTLLYFWLNSIDLAKDRVKQRVIEGGHYVDDSTISRRYVNGLKNLFKTYVNTCDFTLIYDNSQPTPILVAYTEINRKFVIEKKESFQQIFSLVNE
jgi:predicted ABC-type ATPase